MNSAADAIVQNHAGERAGDAAPDPCPPSARTWTRRVDGGGVITETCPQWCSEPHDDAQGIGLGELAHFSAGTSLRVEVGASRPCPPTLAGVIRLLPYEEEAAEREPRVPHVCFEPGDGSIVELDGAGLGEVIAQIRAHADRLAQLQAQLRKLRESAARGN